MLTDTLINILTKYPGKEVGFSPIRHSEYTTTFSENDGIIFYDGEPVSHSICSESTMESNIIEIQDQIWNDKQSRIKPLQDKLTVLNDELTGVKKMFLSEDSKGVYSLIIGKIRTLNLEIDNLNLLVDNIRYESHPITKSVDFAVIDNGDYILILS